MINNKTSMNWLPKSTKEFEEFVVNSSTSDLRYIDQSINLLKFSKDDLLELQKQIQRDMIIRQYFTHPPSKYLRQYIENYDNEDFIKREIEDTYQSQIKELEDYKTNMITSPKESKPKDFSVAEIDNRIKNLHQQAIGDYKTMLERRKSDKPRIQKLFNEVNKQLKEKGFKEL